MAGNLPALVYSGDLSVPTDAKGNAAIGNVVLLVIPPTPGDRAPGSKNIELLAGEAFVLPCWGWLGTHCDDGTRPDTFVSVEILQTLTLKVTLDDVTILDEKNVMQY
jgi:hypothetical protein